MISYENKIIFCRVAKTGSESIIKFFNEKGIKFEKIMPPNWKQDPNHIPLYEIKKSIPEETYEDYFKFAFVRNPWDRFISCYLYHQEWVKENWAEKKTKMNLNSFKEFVLDHKNIPTKYTMQQYEFTKGCDFIGRFENLEEDFEKVCEHLKLPLIKMPHENKTNHKHYSEYYDDETKEIVAKLFKKDIEVFGYKFEIK